MNYLILSTLLHYVSILPLYKYYKDKAVYDYINVILISSTCSVLYHISNTFETIDYIMAFIWFLYDIRMGLQYTTLNTLYTILNLNAIVYILNIIHVNYINKQYYTLLHSIWHIVSAMKCYYVASSLKLKNVNGI